MFNPFSRAPRAPTLDQDFVTRYWDLSGKVDSLEARVEDRLDEIERRYKRAEQAERRLDAKRAEESPCADNPPENGSSGLYDLARRARVATQSTRDSTSG